MPNHRTYTDEQLREAVALSTNWSAVMVAIGKKPGSGTVPVKAVAERLGLDASHFAHARSFHPAVGQPTPFQGSSRRSGQSGPTIAARWFLDLGYMVSLPLEPALYDLVTESDDGLKRIQVKTTRQRQPNGRYVARVSRMERSASTTRNANGNRRAVAYRPDEIDYFFVITPVANYLIPVEAVSGRLYVVLDEKYAAFAV